jgi:hypothetical protein
MFSSIEFARSRTSDFAAPPASASAVRRAAM